MASRSRGIVIPISAEDNSARAFDSVNAQVTRLREQVSTLRAELASLRSGGGAGERVADGFHNATTEVQATSAAIRTLDGNPGIRAVERFLITIPGVGSALLAAFPVIGAIALTGVISRGIERIIQMRQAAEQLAFAIENAFNEAISKERQEADQLALANDQLDNQIAKLEHKPENGLITALDDARVETDKLGDSMQDAAKQAEALFDAKYKVGFFDKLLNGTKSTDPAKQEVLSTLNSVDKLKNEYASVVQEAADSGNSKEHIDELNQMMLGHVEDVYAASTTKLQDQLKAATNSKADDQELGGTGSRYDPIISALQGALGLYAQQQRVIGEQYQHSALAPRISRDKSNNQSDSAAQKAEEQARRLAEAQEKVGEAATKAAEQSFQSQADAAKRAADVAIAQLDDQHKRQLISDRDYYAQKAQLQIAALNAEADANSAKQGALGGQIRSIIIKRGTTDTGNGPARAEDAAKIIDLQTQVNALEDKRLSIVAKRSEIQSAADAEETGAIKKQSEAAEKLAAEVEAIRGDSTTARQQQSDTQYQRQRKELSVQGAPKSELDNLDYQHQVGDADIGLKGAEDTEKNADSGFATSRQSIKYQQQSGQISDVVAQQELIELDKQEAAALQPVLEAYEKLAALNVDGAAQKVSELKEQISELKAPVSEVATEIRSQLDSAFEALFVNMDRGKKAWANFKKSLQTDIMKDTYKQFVEPGLQSVTGMLVPHPGGGSGLPANKGTAASSAVGGIMSKVLPALHLGGGKAAAASSSVPIVQIINQTSTPVQGTATMSGGSSFGKGDGSEITSMLQSHVISIILADLEHGGPVAQAIPSSGGGGGMIQT